MNNNINNYLASAGSAEKYLVSKLQADGSFGPDITDLASYYKAPYLFFISGYTELAERSLNYIVNQFMQTDSSFSTTKSHKTDEPFLASFATYIDGWLALSAQKMSRFETAFPNFQYLRDHYHPEQGAFITEKFYQEGDNVVDVFTTAHLGFVALYFGDLNKAKRSGGFLQRALSTQPDAKSGFYLRLGEDGKHITNFSEEKAKFYFINANASEQYYFILGYIVAFLGKLAAATQSVDYLRTAKAYLDIALKQDSSLYESRLNNQIAWGSAVLAKLTAEEKYKDVALKISDWLVGEQASDGTWASHSANYTKYDATIENAIWLREIVAEICTV